MKQALVAPLEAARRSDGSVIEDGQRIVQVEASSFPVAPPLMWIECADDVTPSSHYWTGAAVAAKPLPLVE